jgi:hypothetical protein
VTTLWKGRSLRKAAGFIATDLKRPGDGPLAHPAYGQRLHLFIQRQAPGTGVSRLAGQGARRDQRWRRRLELRQGSQGIGHLAVEPRDEPLDHLPQVLKKVEVIGDLYGLRCAAPGSSSKGATSVTADHFDARMSRKPRCEGFGGPIRQQIHDPSPLQVHQKSAVPMPTAKGPVIHAQDAHRRRGRDGRGQHPPEEGGWSHHHAYFGS